MLESILSRLNNREFAYFYHYRGEEFTQATRDEIEKEKAARGISENEIAKAVNQKVEAEEGNYPRCNSSFMHTEERIVNLTRYRRYEGREYSHRCVVCGYNPHIDKPLNWKMRIKKFFGFFRWRRLG